ncbi:YcnI family protein [Mycolicibacterium sp. 120266]|uniref:YcnI family copper-binding membrane protein n=1 Tax=Mycolicibacterium sp. 120266 TaxID=3090601 RepID=UPI00299DBD9D|nr:YcnI family protein [Mycolicibacterium sp. 120266]MDX1871496.1 YcnI family protein [Mycolicibacterium sp. 120266]
MRYPHRAPARALLTLAAAGAALITAAPASAHVHVDADDAHPGDTAVLTFRVPGESEKGALTTQFSVTLPNVASARTELMPGWTARLDRDNAAGTVRSVTWTATPPVGISPEQFGSFKISVTLPNQDTVTFPATQTYSDGTVVHWDQPPLPGGGEPEYPAPELSLTGTPEAGHSAAPQPAPTVAAQPAVEPAGRADNGARWLAGGALALAAVAVAVALIGRRRA